MAREQHRLVLVWTSQAAVTTWVANKHGVTLGPYLRQLKIETKPASLAFEA